VVEHRVREDIIGLQEHGNLCAQRFERHFAKIQAVYANMTLLRVDEARNHAYKSMFGVVVESQHGGLGACGDRGSNTTEQGSACRSLDRDFLETDPLAQRRKKLGADVHLKLGLAVDERKHPARGARS